jgi:calcineurin-like phosphoesterase family protein
MRFTSLVLFIGLCAAMATMAQTTENPIAIGPYLQNVNYERAVICWATLESETTIKSEDGDEAKLPTYEVHELLMGDLRPDTTYEYDVLGDGSDHGKGTFTTFPKEIQPFRFVVLGDTRSNHEVHANAVRQVIAKKPLFAINTGDLVSDGLNIDHWRTFFEINSDLMRTIPYFPVLGNHENNSPYYYQFFSLPQNEQYYMFVVGDALFLVLDVEGYDYDTPQYMSQEDKVAWWSSQNLDYMEQQKAWVERLLTLHDSAGYIFVFFHEPLISVKGSRVTGANFRRAFWDGIFERHRVNVVFTGHDHHYHHAQVSESTHFITTAGGGAGLYDPDTPAPETKVIDKSHHFCTVEVGESEAKVTAIKLEGGIIEEVVLPRRHP